MTKTLTLNNPIVVNESGTVHVPKGIILNTYGKISGIGLICKTGDGVWNHYGDCLHSVDIHIDHKSIFQGCCITSDDGCNQDLLDPGFHHLGSLIIHRNYKKTSLRYYFFK